MTHGKIVLACEEKGKWTWTAANIFLKNGDFITVKVLEDLNQTSLEEFGADISWIINVHSVDLKHESFDILDRKFSVEIVSSWWACLILIFIMSLLGIVSERRKNDACLRFVWKFPQYSPSIEKLWVTIPWPDSIFAEGPGGSRMASCHEVRWIGRLLSIFIMEIFAWRWISG